ncbi:MAG: hypothetical protein EXX96DRAFT_548001 [Benjaminiella poitrasii]|nr:MAG: hypothetical protein EXX96DRAFT_548001 [Benjaminiella poitrasii]
MGILRLGIASKRAIDKWHLSGCLAFMVNGFYISFFVVRKQCCIHNITIGLLYWDKS